MAVEQKRKNYPGEFTKRVKEEYPDNKELHAALDSGDRSVSGLLHHASQGDISPEKIVTMIDQGKTRELRQEAEQLVRRKKLHEEWFTIDRKMNG
jgi:hypothetical protein